MTDPAGVSAPFDLSAFAAVIFDCDGVIADSEPASVDSWVEATSAHGLTVTAEEVESFIGKTEHDLALHFAPLAGVEIELMEETAKRSFLALVDRDGLETFPDAIALLEHVRRLGLPFGVGSNSVRWRLDAVLKGTGMMEEIPLSVAGDEVPHPKPAPDVYAAVAAKLGVAPADALVIEDTPTGIRSAKDAGCTVIAIYRGAVERSLLSDADLVVDRLWPDRS